MKKHRIVSYFTESGLQISRREFLRFQTENLSDFVAKRILIKNGSFTEIEISKLEKRGIFDLIVHKRKKIYKKDGIRDFLIKKGKFKQKALF